MTEPLVDPPTAGTFFFLSFGALVAFIESDETGNGGRKTRWVGAAKGSRLGTRNVASVCGPSAKPRSIQVLSQFVVEEYCFCFSRNTEGTQGKFAEMSTPWSGHLPGVDAFHF